MDIKPMLDQALRELGCDPNQFQFDGTPPIVFNFKDVGELVLDQVDDHYWLWGSLPEGPVEALRGCALELLQVLGEPADYMASGCLALRLEQDTRLVGGALQPQCLQEAARLADAIEGTYVRLSQMHELAR